MSGGLALAPTPELLAEVDALPPADDDPEVDVVAEAAAARVSGSGRSSVRTAVRSLVGFTLIVVDTLLTLAGPFLVQQGLNEGVQQHATGRAVGRVGRCSSSPRSSTGSSPGPTPGTPAAPRNGCCSRCASGSSRTCSGSSLDYYDRELAGRIMTRMTTDVDAFAQLLQTGLITALVNVLSFVGVLVVLSLISWPLTLGVLVARAAARASRPSGSAAVRPGVRARARDASPPSTPSSRRASPACASRAGVRAGGPQRRLVPHDARGATSTPGSRTQVLQAIYFPFILFLATCGDAIVLGLGSVARARRHASPRAP